jgi:predicted nucleotidyltransferase
MANLLRAVWHRSIIRPYLIPRRSIGRKHIPAIKDLLGFVVRGFEPGSTGAQAASVRHWPYNAVMKSKRRTVSPALPTRLYWGADVPMGVIRRFARRVAECFQPDKVILFGSHAYGTPHADSDVDILVIMPARNQHDQAARIRWRVPAPFPMDLLVRTPKNLSWRLAEGDSFHAEIMTRGKVLYEKNHARVGSQSRKRLRSRRGDRQRGQALSR